MVVSTGGFAADRALLDRHCPAWAHFATTAGAFSTGDGIRLARKLRAAVVDLDKIQILGTPADQCVV